MNIQQYIDYSKKMLIGAMRKEITYTPNKHRDAFAFMEEYIAEARYDNRQDMLDEILENLSNCATGKEYPCPHEIKNSYTHDDIDKLEAQLNDFLAAMKSSKGNQPEMNSAKTQLRKYVADLKADIEKDMIDDWRHGCVEDLITKAENLVLQENRPQAPKQQGPTLDMM